MYTNEDRLHTLEAMKASLNRYNGPIGIMGGTPEGVDDDIWKALHDVDTMIEKRIKEIWDKGDLELEAM